MYNKKQTLKICFSDFIECPQNIILILWLMSIERAVQLYVKNAKLQEAEVWNEMVKYSAAPK